jgi:hypothetical protein
MSPLRETDNVRSTEHRQTDIFSDSERTLTENQYIDNNAEGHTKDRFDFLVHNLFTMHAKGRKQKSKVFIVFAMIQLALLWTLRHMFGIDKVSDFNMVGMIEGILLIFIIDRILYGIKSKHGG